MHKYILYNNINKIKDKKNNLLNMFLLCMWHLIRHFYYLCNAV